MTTSRTGTAEYKHWRTQVLHHGKRDGIDRCPTCGVWLDYNRGRRPNSAEPDHLTPWSLGGKNTIDNGRILCRRCNQKRGNGKKRGKRRPTANRVQTINFQQQ